MEQLEREKEEKRKQQQLEAERLAEQQRQRDMQLDQKRKQAHDTRVQQYRETQKEQALQAEKARLEVLHNRRAIMLAAIQQSEAHKNSLIESSSSQIDRQKELEARMHHVEASVETVRSAIGDMRGRRDTYAADFRSRLEQSEAAKVELTRWQREYDELQTNTLNKVSADQREEQLKALNMSIQVRKQNIVQMRDNLTSIDKMVTQKGQELASQRNKLNGVHQNQSKLVNECKELKKKLLDLKGIKVQEDEPKQSNFELAFGSLNLNDASKTTQSQFPQDPFGSAFTSVPTGQSSVHNSIPPQPNQGAGQICRALYDFTARKDDELTFQVGDQVTLISTEAGEGWLYGEFQGKKGFFPEAFVEQPHVLGDQNGGKIDPFDPFGVHKKAEENDALIVLAEDKNEPHPFNFVFRNDKTGEGATDTHDKTLFYCRGRYPYKSDVDGDLHFKVGDLIRVYNEKEDWLDGELVESGAKGMFPKNYVTILEESDLPPSLAETTAPNKANNPVGDFQSVPTVTTGASGVESTLSSNPVDASGAMPSEATLNENVETVVGASGKPEIARVIAAYTATNIGQLSLVPGQMVQIRKRSVRGWWEGELQQRGQKRRVGWFPADYVRILTPPTNQKSTSSPNKTPPARPPPLNQALVNQRSSSPKTTPSAVPPSKASGRTDTVNVTSVSSAVLDGISAGQVVRAAFEYVATYPDELSFGRGDLIEVVGREEPLWWRGRLKSSGLEGLFPVNYVRPVEKVNGNCISSEKTSSQLIEDKNMREMRSSVIEELCSTEKAYYLNLLEVRNLFQEPLEKSRVYEIHMLQMIFINWDELIGSTYEFYMALTLHCKYGDAKDFSDVLMGKFLYDELSKLHGYKDFVRRQSYAVDFLLDNCQRNPLLAADIKKGEQFSQNPALPFSTYYTKPMQRLTKYKLLINQMIKYTPENHADFKSLGHAEKLISDMIDDLDKAVFKEQTKADLYWLQRIIMPQAQLNMFTFDTLTAMQHQRRVIMAGPLKKLKSGKDLLVVFLSDCIFFIHSPAGNLQLSPHSLYLPSDLESPIYQEVLGSVKQLLRNKLSINNPGIPSLNVHSIAPINKYVRSQIHQLAPYRHVYFFKDSVLSVQQRSASVFYETQSNNLTINTQEGQPSGRTVTPDLSVSSMLTNPSTILSISHSGSSESEVIHLKSRTPLERSIWASAFEILKKWNQ